MFFINCDPGFIFKTPPQSKFGCRMSGHFAIWYVFTILSITCFKHKTQNGTVKRLLTRLSSYQNPLYTKHDLWSKIYLFLHKQPLKLDTYHCPERVLFRRLSLFIILSSSKVLEHQVEIFT